MTQVWPDRHSKPSSVTTLPPKGAVTTILHAGSKVTSNNAKAKTRECRAVGATGRYGAAMDNRQYSLVALRKSAGQRMTARETRQT